MRNNGSTLLGLITLAIVFAAGYLTGYVVYRNPNPPAIKYDIDFRLWPMPLPDGGRRNMQPEAMPFPASKPMLG
jgi:hypothetical protein